MNDQEINKINEEAEKVLRAAERYANGNIDKLNAFIAGASWEKGKELDEED